MPLPTVVEEILAKGIGLEVCLFIGLGKDANVSNVIALLGALDGNGFVRTVVCPASQLQHDAARGGGDDLAA